MNRRQFFKTIAATLVAGTAAVVAPAVARDDVWVWQDGPIRTNWDSYYDGHENLDDPTFLIKLDAATKKIKFIPPIRK